MAYRKTRRKRHRGRSGKSTLIFVMLSCLLIGTVVGFLTRSEYVPSLSSFSRDELEGEVKRLNREIAERDKNIDELRIELKLVSQGSSSGRKR